MTKQTKNKKKRGVASNIYNIFNCNNCNVREYLVHNKRVDKRLELVQEGCLNCGNKDK